jgi:hypothetical protein
MGWHACSCDTAPWLALDVNQCLLWSFLFSVVLRAVTSEFVGWHLIWLARVHYQAGQMCVSVNRVWMTRRQKKLRPCNDSLPGIDRLQPMCPTQIKQLYAPQHSQGHLDESKEGMLSRYLQQCVQRSQARQAVVESKTTSSCQY